MSETGEAMQAKARTYCKPWEAGLASEAAAVGRTIGKILDSLGVMGPNLVDGGPGTIERDCWEFRMRLMDKLKAEGWLITVNRHDNWQVLPPKAGR